MASSASVNGPNPSHGVQPPDSRYLPSLEEEKTPFSSHPRPSHDEKLQQCAPKAKRLSDGSARHHMKRNSVSSRTTAASSTQAGHHHEHGDVRTLPPWIDSVEDSDEDLIPSKPTDMLLPAPPRAQTAQHHYASNKPERRKSQDGYVSSDDDDSHENMPKSTERGLFGGSKEPDKGRKWDHARQGDPVIVQSRNSQMSSPWKAFVRSSMYGPTPHEEVQRVDDVFLDQQARGYENPWRGDVEGVDPEKALGLRHIKKRRRVWYERIQHNLLMHPLVPLSFRIVVLATSTLSLGLSGSIYQLTNVNHGIQNPSTVIAIVVDVVAIPYIGYIIWDEYTGKPLGLRSPRAKMRLVLLDLFFIIFESANLSLAFAVMVDQSGSCGSGPNGVKDMGLCGRERTLGAFLFIALMTWILTFSVSIFRLVERVGGREDHI